jgi:hypothetical protein
MKELIAGRIMKTMKDEEGLETQRSPAEIMAEAILEGMEGKLVLSHNQYGDVIANPLHAVKLYQDYMLKAKELAIRKAELDKKQKGATGGIRIVLPSHVADPLLRLASPRGRSGYSARIHRNRYQALARRMTTHLLARHQLGAGRFR